MTWTPICQPFPPQTSGQGLLVEVDGSEAGPRRVRVRGELDLATSPLFAGALDRLAQGRYEVTVDLSELAFCDVVGLTAIEQAHQRLAARGCHLTLHGTARLRLLLSVPGLFDLPPLDEPDAAAAL